MELNYPCWKKSLCYTSSEPAQISEKHPFHTHAGAIQIEFCENRNQASILALGDLGRELWF